MPCYGPWEWKNSDSEHPSCQLESGKALTVSSDGLYCKTDEKYINSWDWFGEGVDLCYVKKFNIALVFWPVCNHSLRPFTVFLTCPLWAACLMA